MATSQDLAVVRKALVRELETLNHYQELHDQASDAAVRQLMLHLMNEEKEHVAELTVMLRALDPAQDGVFAAEHSKAIAQGDLQALATRAGSGGGQVRADSGLTVGSLFGQR